MMHNHPERAEPASRTDKLALLVEMLPTATSLRDLGKALGMSLEAVRRDAAPFLAIMKLNGTHPKCGCGRDRFHPYGCVDNYAKGERGDCFPGHTAIETAVLLARRTAIFDAIMTGAKYSEIERQLGLSRKSARKYLRFMSAEQVAERKRLERERSS